MFVHQLLIQVHVCFSGGRRAASLNSRTYMYMYMYARYVAVITPRGFHPRRLNARRQSGEQGA